MGAHSTITVTRQAAINKIICFINNASNQEIEDILDIILYDRLYNSCIVGEYEENENHLLQ